MLRLAIRTLRSTQEQSRDGKSPTDLIGWIQRFSPENKPKQPHQRQPLFGGFLKNLHQDRAMPEISTHRCRILMVHSSTSLVHFDLHRSVIGPPLGLDGGRRGGRFA